MNVTESRSTTLASGVPIKDLKEEHDADILSTVLTLSVCMCVF